MLRSLASEYDSFMTWLKFLEIFAYAPETGLFEGHHDKDSHQLLQAMSWLRHITSLHLLRVTQVEISLELTICKDKRI